MTTTAPSRPAEGPEIPAWVTAGDLTDAERAIREANYRKARGVDLSPPERAQPTAPGRPPDRPLPKLAPASERQDAVLAWANLYREAGLDPVERTRGRIAADDAELDRLVSEATAWPNTRLDQFIRNVANLLRRRRLLAARESAIVGTEPDPKGLAAGVYEVVLRVPRWAKEVALQAERAGAVRRLTRQLNETELTLQHLEIGVTHSRASTPGNAEHSLGLTESEDAWIAARTAGDAARADLTARLQRLGNLGLPPTDDELIATVGEVLGR